jgi:2-dehydro-3-deoxyphosphogluconate aldolase/(4S)-4-hydroxy-2-oxoglutarate aldolase
MDTTGGIGPANLHEYLAIDAVAAVGGSWMVPRRADRGRDFATVQRLTTDAVALLRSPTSHEPSRQAGS